MHSDIATALRCAERLFDVCACSLCQNELLGGCPGMAQRAEIRGLIAVLPPVVVGGGGWRWVVVGGGGWRWVAVRGGGWCWVVLGGGGGRWWVVVSRVSGGVVGGWWCRGWWWVLVSRVVSWVGGGVVGSGGWWCCGWW